MAIDLDAEIVPGVSAAGFRIGDSLDDILGRISRSLDYQTAFSLANIGDGLAFNSAQSLWKFYRNPRGYALLYGQGVELPDQEPRCTVSLGVSSTGILHSIILLPGYRGRHASGIGIGTAFGEALAREDLVWDSGDELFYPTEAARRSWSIMINTDDGNDPLVLLSEPIIGFTVYDLDLQDRRH